MNLTTRVNRMSKLTDLEICQRIAEIEGVTDTVNVAIKAISNQKYHSIFNPSNVTSPPTFDEIYNPLTDDAMCFRLMVKYNVSFWQNEDKGMFCAKVRDPEFGVIRVKKPNIAICIAIIESKEPKT
jgi:hypothetical protein